MLQCGIAFNCCGVSRCRTRPFGRFLPILPFAAGLMARGFFFAHSQLQARAFSSAGEAPAVQERRARDAGLRVSKKCAVGSALMTRKPASLQLFQRRLRTRRFFTPLAGSPMACWPRRSRGPGALPLVCAPRRLPRASVRRATDDGRQLSGPRHLPSLMRWFAIEEAAHITLNCGALALVRTGIQLLSGDSVAVSVGEGRGRSDRFLRGR